VSGGTHSIIVDGISKVSQHHALPKEEETKSSVLAPMDRGAARTERPTLHKREACKPPNPRMRYLHPSSVMTGHSAVVVRGDQWRWPSDMCCPVLLLPGTDSLHLGRDGPEAINNPPKTSGELNHPQRTRQVDAFSCG
jgi:hypothetical protein